MEIEIKFVIQYRFFILRVSNFVEWKLEKTSVMFVFDSKSVIIEAIYAEAKDKSLK